MPNLDFSPGPQHPPQPDHHDGGEKENASTPPLAMTGAGATKKVAALSDRSPLEILPAAASSAAVVCKRDSSCKCSDCDMAASVFGIDELRRVGGAPPGSPDAGAICPPMGGGGGLPRSPVGGFRSNDGDSSSAAAADGAVAAGDSVPSSPPVESDDAAAISADGSHQMDGARHDTAAAPPATPGAVVASPTSAAIHSAPPRTSATPGDHASPNRASDKTAIPPPAAASDEATSPSLVGSQPSQDLGERQTAATATPTGDVRGGGRVRTPGSGEVSSSAKSESSSKKKGWGFRMARAVFSPRTLSTTKPEKQQQKEPQQQPGAAKGGGGGDSATTMTSTEFSDELKDEATAVVAEADGASRMADTVKDEAVEADDVAQVPVGSTAAGTAVTGEDSTMGAGDREDGPAGDCDGPLPDEEPAEEEELKEERQERGPADDVNDLGASPVAGETCKPPLLPRGRDYVEKDAAAAAAAGLPAAGLDGVLGNGVAAATVAAAGGGTMRRSASGRRLSKDVFFECSTEVEHVLTSDSDSDREADRRASLLLNNNNNNLHHPEDEQAATAPPSPPLASDSAVPQPEDAVTTTTTTTTTTTNNTTSGNAGSPAPVKTRAPLTPTTTFASGGGGVSALAASAAMPISPVVEANSPAVALDSTAPPEAAAAAATAADAGAAMADTTVCHAGGGGGHAGGSEKDGIDAAVSVEGGELPVTHAAATGDPDSHIDLAPQSENAVASTDTTECNDAGDDAERTKSQDVTQDQEGGARGVLGVGRRRNRRQGPQLELGMAAAYGHEHDRAKFSQAEVDAKIKERLAEEQAAFEKTMSAMKAAHEAEMQAAADRLQQSSSDGNRAKIAARDAEALEREIAMLSERYGEAAAEAKTTGKALLEKEALLDAVTAQLMGLKTDLAAARAEHAAEKQAISASADEERRARSLAEGNLQQLEAAYNRLEDSEREKRAAGILKMKNDMKALAREQFAGANKKHAALKARLERSEAQARLMGEEAKEHDAKLKAAEQKTKELRSQVEAVKKAQADSAASAARREQLLEEEVRILRDEAESRLDEMEAMARERDSANNGREVSQDALARMAIRNTQMKESVADLEGKVKELEGFCTEALDELDAEKAKNAQLLAA